MHVLIKNPTVYSSCKLIPVSLAALNAKRIQTLIIALRIIFSSETPCYYRFPKQIVWYSQENFPFLCHNLWLYMYVQKMKFPMNWTLA